MSLPHMSPSIRVRRTPFTRRVEEAGVKAYSVYNRMLIPGYFHSIEEDYAHLKRAVQVWDVSCERQVEIRGSRCIGPGTDDHTARPVTNDRRSMLLRTNGRR